MGDVHKKVLDTRCLVTTPVLTTKFSEIVNKTPDTSSLVTTTVPNTKISQVEKKFLIMLNTLILLNLIS